MIEDNLPRVYEKIPVPKIIQNIEKTLSSVVNGGISPYPTVVRVYRLHSNDAIYFLNKESSWNPFLTTHVLESKSLILAKNTKNMQQGD